MLLYGNLSLQCIAHIFDETFKDAGLPRGVINFLPGSGSLMGLNNPNLAGVHFTGSTSVFRDVEINW